MTLMKSVSGIRGIWGNDITPENIMQYAAAFGQFQQSRFPKKRAKILVGRDSRTTGATLAHSAIAGLLGVGIDVVWLGIVATPTLLYNIKPLKANGGIVITASHNHAQWNALKFVDANGLFLFPKVMDIFLTTLNNCISHPQWDNMGNYSEDFDHSHRHIQKILQISYLPVDTIRKKRFKVVLDSVNGAGCVISPSLLTELGCEVVHINSEPNGHFAHTPEPLSQNLTQICKAVKKHKADVGFATDPDVDRLAIIDENGNCIGEEFSLLLAERFILSHKKGTIVTNLSSSMANDDVAREFKVKVARTKVGEINVGSLMKQLKSPVGGEGNGGIICPEVNYTRDAITGMALILGLLAETGKTVSQLVSTLPKYYIAKNRIESDQTTAQQIVKKAETLYPNAKLDTTDGVKIIFKDAWIHIRKSGTEPIVRVYVEATSQEEADRLCEETMGKLGMRNEE